MTSALMKHLRWLLFFAIFFPVFLGGCTHYYTPNLYPLNSNEIPELQTSQPIELINNQSGSEEIIFTRIGAHKYTGRLDEWTDIAIRQLKGGMLNKGVPVQKDSSKRLKVTVTRVAAQQGFWMIRGIVDVRIETGDGYNKVYTGSNPSPGGLYRAWDGAIALAVMEILKDPEIGDYIRGERGERGEKRLNLEL